MVERATGVKKKESWRESEGSCSWERWERKWKDKVIGWRGRFTWNGTHGVEFMASQLWPCPIEVLLSGARPRWEEVGRGLQMGVNWRSFRWNMQREIFTPVPLLRPTTPAHECDIWTEGMKNMARSSTHLLVRLVIHILCMDRNLPWKRFGAIMQPLPLICCCCGYTFSRAIDRDEYRSLSFEDAERADVRRKRVKALKF